MSNASFGRVRIAVPAPEMAGAVIQIRTLIAHPMESGFRADARGQRLPRNIIERFECWLDDTPVFGCDLQPGIAANPFIEFALRAERSGTLHFLWRDQHGNEHREQRNLAVPG
ncbi:MAG: thiosulfate oxidation carrier complex protein SoxZ [Pseudomonadota bacterium]